MITLAISWSPDPELFSIGSFSVRWYGLMFVFAFFFGLYIGTKIFKKDKAPSDWVDKLFIYVIIATLVGARLGHVFFYDWAYYKDHLLEIILPVRFNPDFKFIGYRGLASHGAAAGIIFALWLFSLRVSKKSILWVLDRVVIPVALGGCFIRIGNLMNSEIFGIPTELPWGFQFYNAIELGADRATPRHPTQIYEALWYLISFGILMYMYWKTNAKQKSGLLFGSFLVLVFAFRFFVEFIKNDQVQFEANMTLNMGQWLSIPFVLVGLYFILRKKKIP